jgi:hypothetical protein
MKRTPGNTPAAKDKYWTKIIEEARRYPQGVTEYCRVMNISKNNYYFWFRRLRTKHPEWRYDLTNRPEGKTLGRQKEKPQNSQTQSSQVVPKTEVTEKPQRRKWLAADRQRILEETDGLSGPDLSAALRREGLYVHTLNKWRTQRDLTTIATNKRNGTHPLFAENKKLKEENARLQKKLHQASEIIQIQKKISQMLTMSLEETEEQ